MADIGLETITIDRPTLIVEAYVNELNNQGGINGNCFELLSYEWDLTSPEAIAEALQRVCTEVPAKQPIFILSLTLHATVFDCLTMQAQIPTLSLYTHRA